MQENPFDDYPFPDLDNFDPNAPVPLHECCICLAQPVKAIVRIENESFPFCAGCDYRAMLLQRGQTANWPALRIEGGTSTYAVSGGAQAYVLTALQGTDDRVVELLSALDEYEASRSAGEDVA